MSDSYDTNSDEVIVSYAVTIPQTKAVLGNGEAVNYVWYAQYDNETEELVKSYPPVAIFDGAATCPVTMMRDQSYKVVFVAQHYNKEEETLTPVYSIDATEATIAMPEKTVANSSDCEIFAKMAIVLDYQGGNTAPVVLDRLVAQVNFMCLQDDWNAAQAINMTPTASALKLEGVPETYDLLDGTFSSKTVTVEYAKAGLTGEANVLGTVFCFADGLLTKTSLMMYKGEELTTQRDVESLKAEANCRTNVTGMIMTGTLSYEISMDVEGTEITHPLN